MIALAILALTPTGVALFMCALERWITRDERQGTEAHSGAQNRPTESRSGSL